MLEGESVQNHHVSSSTDPHVVVSTESSLYCETCGIQFGDSLSLARHRGTAAHRKWEARAETRAISTRDLESVRALVEELAREKGDRVVETRRGVGAKG